jgi:hypothetical protein
MEARIASTSRMWASRFMTTAAPGSRGALGDEQLHRRGWARPGRLGVGGEVDRQHNVNPRHPYLRGVRRDRGND